jgi:hypothetical protein
VIVAVAEDEQSPQDCLGTLIHDQDGWQVRPTITAPNE